MFPIFFYSVLESEIKLLIRLTPPGAVELDLICFKAVGLCLIKFIVKPDLVEIIKFCSEAVNGVELLFGTQRRLL